MTAPIRSPKRGDGSSNPLGDEPCGMISRNCKKDEKNKSRFRWWVKVAKSGELYYTCVVGTWKSIDIRVTIGEPI